MKLLQRVFIIFIGILIPWNSFAFIDFNNDLDNYQLVTSWSDDDFLNALDFKRFEKDTLIEVASDSLSTDSLEKEEKPFLETAIEYNCDDTIVFSLTGQKVFLTKNAFVKYGEIELKAYYIELDLEKKEAFAYGIKDTTDTFIDTPEFKDGSEEFSCKELKYNFDSGKGLVSEIITEQEGGFVHSEVTKRIDDKTFYLRNGKYTTCDHPHPHFYVKMTKAKMIKDDKIISGPLYLVLEDVPLPIGLPFALFPFSSSYSSGVIVPSYGEEQRRGFNLRGGGYYWAINDYLDLSLTGDIFANGSWGTYMESSYKNRYRYSGNLGAEYHSNTYGDKGLSDYLESTDFAVRWTHTQDSKANPYRTFSASVNFSTSNNDRNNSTSIEKITNNQKQSSISYSKKWADSPFSLNGSLRHSQNSIDTTISLTLPSMSLNMTQIYPFRKKGKSSNLRWYDKVGVSYSSKLENKISIKEDSLFKSSLSKDWNNGYQHSIPISTNFKLTKDLTLSPTFNYKGVLYSKSIEKSWDADLNDGEGGVQIDTIQGFKYAHNYSTSASLSLSPKIYGMYTFKESSKLAAIRHVMTPSVSVSYTPEIGVSRSKYYKTYFNESTGEDVEYSMFEGSMYGTPTGALESGSVSFGLDNNVEAKMRVANDSTGTEEFEKVKIIESLKFTTSYNMFADSLNWSKISMSGRTKLFNKKLGLTVRSTIDPYKLSADNVRIDEFGPRLTSAAFDLDFSFSSKDLQGGNGRENEEDKGSEKWKDPRYVDFDIPWTFSIKYGWTYSKPTDESTVKQTLSLNGNFSLTPKWKVSFSTGYDFDASEVISTQFSITRDLHCWQMSFNAVPFGTYQSYNFRINVESSILQDLKYEKKQAWQDVNY